MKSVFFCSPDVYDRLVQNGKKPGFFQLLATQTVSAVWHVSVKHRVVLLTTCTFHPVIEKHFHFYIIENGYWFNILL